MCNMSSTRLAFIKVKVKLYSFFNLGDKRGWLVNATPRPLHPRETNAVPIVERLGKSQGRSWRTPKISPPPGYDPRKVQPVASRSTDYVQTAYWPAHFSFYWHYNPLAGFSLLILKVSRSHTMTQHSRQDSSGRVISPSQRPLPDKHTTLTTDRHPCPRRDSNLQPQ